MSKPFIGRFLLITIILLLVTAATATHANTVSVRFFADGKLVQVNRFVPDDLSPAEAAVRALVAGPYIEEIAVGISSAIPAGVKINKLKISSTSADIDLSSDVVAGLDEQALNEIFDQFRATLGDFPSITAIMLTSGGKTLSSYLPKAPDVGESAEPLVAGNAVGLSGKKICVGASHGRFWNGSGWYWQRSDPCGFGEAILEDTNSVRLTQFLEQYIKQDGGTFYGVRCHDEGYGNHSSGTAWWKMCSQSWLRGTGVPCSVWASYTGNCGADTAVGRSSDDIRCRPLYADYVGSNIYIAFHTNAGGGTGTETFRDTAMEKPAHVANSLTLAQKVQSNIISTIRNTFPGESGWADRGVKDGQGNYGEIRIPNRPAVLVELGFHDHCTRDAVYLKNDFFRSLCTWAMYKGICEYFGNTPTWGKYSGEAVSNTIPATMTTGQSYSVSIKMRNRGVCWMSAYGFKLGAVSGNTPMTTTTLHNVSGTVRPGGETTFTFTMTAPTTPGTYTTAWRMVRDGYEWFGPTVSKTITVQAATGNISGTVRSSFDNSVMSGVTVAVTGGTSATTNASGVYTLSNLSPGTYTLTVSKTGYTTQTGTAAVTAGATTTKDFTLVSSDATPPSVPQNLRRTALSKNSITIAWDASTDNVGVVGYRIYRDGTQVGTSTTTTYTDTGLSANTGYSYQVDAYDGRPNYSAKSAVLDTGTGGTWTQSNAKYTSYVRSGSPDVVGSGGIAVGYSATENLLIRRGLIQWDMTGAPTASEIINAADSVRVKLYQYTQYSSSASADISLYKVNNDWDETNGTWNNVGIGAKYTGATVACTNIGDRSWGWNGSTLGAPLANRGVYVKNDTSESDPNFAKIFDNRADIGGSGKPPRLEIDYIDLTAPSKCSIKINGGAAQTNNTMVTLTLSATDYLSGVSKMAFSSDGTTYSAAENYATSKTFTLSSGDGNKTVYAKFMDKVGNWSAAVSASISLYTIAPTGTISINGGAAYTKSAAVTLTLSSSNATQMRFRNESDDWSAWQSYAASKAWTLSAGDGAKTISVEYKDAASNVSVGTISDTITLDTTIPLIDNVSAPAISDRASITISYAASDALSGIKKVTLWAKKGANGTWAATTKTSTAASGSLVYTADEDDTYFFGIVAEDNAGNVSAAPSGSGSASTVVNTAPPTGTITINGGADYTNSKSVTLTLSSTTAVQMRFRNALGEWSEWGSYATSKPWTLDSDDGEKTVYVEFKNATDKVNVASISADIILDTVDPTIDGLTSPIATNSGTIQINYEVSDLGSGIGNVRLWAKIGSDGDWFATNQVSTDEAGSFAFTADAEKTYFFDIVVEDNAGNKTDDPEGDGRTSTDRDITAPTGTFAINDGAAYTNTRSVTMIVYSSDAVDVRFRNESDAWGEWLECSAEVTWLLSSADGTKTVYAQLRDAAGNVSSGTISDTIILDTVPPTGTITINGGAAYTNTTSVTLALSSADAVQVRFRNELGEWSEWGSYSSGKSWALSIGDGLKSVNVEFKDVAGNIFAAGSAITLDTTPPVGTIAINGGAGYTNNTSVNLTLSCGDAVQMRLRNESGSWIGWETFAASRAWTLSSGDGAKTVYVEYKDAAGNVSVVSISGSIALVTNPVTITSVTSPAAVNISYIPVSYAIAEGGVGVKDVTLWVKKGVGGTWAATDQISTDAEGVFYYLANGEDTYFFDVVVEDTIGNMTDTPSGSGRTSTILDTTPPTGTILINGGAVLANNVWVALTLSSSDAVTMRFKNENGAWSAWEGYATSRAWTLSGGDGVKTVYVQYRDAAGNVSPSTIADIILDMTPPTGTININNGALYANTAAVTLNLSSPDAISVRFKNENGSWSAWESFSASKAWILSSGDGFKTVYVQFRDPAGNPSASLIRDIILDTTAPVGSILINNGEAYTESNSVTLTLICGDAVQMQIRNESGDWAAWESYITQKSWILSDGDGAKSVFVRFKDAAGNVSVEPAVADITLGAPEPIAAYGLSNKAAWDPIIAIASSGAKFTLWGKVLFVDDDTFYVDDGSGKPVKINFTAHGFTAADFVSATGVLDVTGAAPVMNAITVKKLN